MSRQSVTIAIGLLAGLLYFGNAMINYSHAWPLVWPLLAGGAVVIATIRKSGTVSFWREVGVATETGVIAGVVFFAASAVALSAMGMSGSYGVRGLVLAAALGCVLTIMAGAVTYPFARRRFVG